MTYTHATIQELELAHAVNAGTSLREAAGQMLEANADVLVVVQSGQVIGTLGMREVMACFMAERNSTGEGTPVEEALASRPAFVRLGTDPRRCLELMAARHCQALLVVKDGELVGVQTMEHALERLEVSVVGEGTWGSVRTH